MRARTAPSSRSRRTAARSAAAASTGRRRSDAPARHRPAARAAPCGARRGGRDAPGGGGASGATPRRAQVGHEPASLGELFGRVRREVALAQHLDRAPPHRERGDAVVFIVARRDVVVGAHRCRRRRRAGSSSGRRSTSSASVVRRRSTGGTRGRRSRCPPGGAPRWPGRPSTRRRAIAGIDHRERLGERHRRRRPELRCPPRGARARSPPRPGRGCLVVE